MADEKRQLILELLAKNKMSKDTDDAAKDIEKLATAADSADKSTESLGKSTKETDDQIGKFGRSSNDTKGRIANLNGEIENSQRELVGLAESFERAGSASERIDITKSIRRTETDIRNLTKSKGILESILPDPEPEAKSFFQKLDTSLTSGASGISNLLGSKIGITLGASAGAAAAPEIAGAISALVSSGAGLIGIGAGIALAVKKDPVIQKAGSDAGHKFISGLETIADKNLQGPILESLALLGKAGETVTEQWGAAFKVLGPQIRPLTQDIIKAGTTISGSLAGAAENSAPALKGLGDSIIILGNGVSNFITILSNGGPEAASNLRLIAGATADVLTQTATFLNFLDKISANPWITGPLTALLRKHYDNLADGSEQLSATQGKLATAANDTTNAMNGQRAAITNLATAVQAQQDPVFAFAKAQETLRDAQDKLNTTTKRYGPSSSEARQATRDLAAAASDLQSKAGETGAVLSGKLTPSMRATLKAAGLTKTQIDAIAHEFGIAQKAANDYAKTYKATVITQHVDTYAVGGADYNREAARGNLGKRAAGGPVARGVPYIVGEQGPEIMVPDVSGRIVNASATRGVMVRGNGNTGGSAPRAIRVEVAGNDQKLVTLLKYLIRTANVIE